MILFVDTGLRDESTNHIAEEEKNKAVKAVIELYDKDNSGTVSFGEFVDGFGKGVRLPDFGQSYSERV